MFMGRSRNPRRPRRAGSGPDRAGRGRRSARGARREGTPDPGTVTAAASLVLILSGRETRHEHSNALARHAAARRAPRQRQRPRRVARHAPADRGAVHPGTVRICRVHVHRRRQPRRVVRHARLAARSRHSPPCSAGRAQFSRACGRTAPAISIATAAHGAWGSVLDRLGSWLLMATDTVPTPQPWYHAPELGWWFSALAT